MSWGRDYYIYLDYNATTPALPEVCEVLRFYAADVFYNPSSRHALGRLAREALEESRVKVGSLIGAKPSEIVFTSSGTEANHLAILGLLRAKEHRTGRKGHLIVASFEHPSILNLAVKLLDSGYDVDFLEVTPQGYVEPEALRRRLRKDTILVSIMWANNEIGTIQPVAELARICKEQDIIFHTDASQAVGKIPVSVEEVSADLLTISGHKLYAPKGIGALYLRDRIKVEPLFVGGGQEMGLRAGTEPVALIAALAKACEVASADLEAEWQRELALKATLYQGLKDIYQELHLFGSWDLTLPNTLTVSFVGLSADKILQDLPQICASTSAACHDRRASITLTAMKTPPEIAEGTIRFSLGRFTTPEDIDRTLELLRDYLKDKT